MEVGLINEFEPLWESGDGPPDVFAFLSRHPDAKASEVVAVLLRDQQQRWKIDEPLKVEDYLARLPELASDSNAKLQLAVGEYQSRLNGDTVPNINEFTSRFDDISDSLRLKLEEVAFATLTSDSTVGDRHIGRYRLSRMLGRGAFGVVWLGFDTELHRHVAIKVPSADRFIKTEDAETYLAEARTVARLDHSNIVPVHDVGRSNDGSVYVVSKYIDGGTLADRIAQERPEFDESAKLIATCAMALGHAHEKRLIHRDVKPANILIEEATGTPYVADFGLAIREEDHGQRSGLAGTPAYMSPEQARGEGHRLDGRSDIFSLGVVCYELLTGKRPFRGSTANELLHKVVSVDPSNLRDIDDSIPAELERICLKALSKRASDRYATAAEFADDLLHWQQGSEQKTKELQITPKGLRSFDAADADFFLDLLPGPRNRDGLPESIQFWKTRIEETDPDKTFSVGLIYGPSGCGKSSLVKAGLLPRLSEDVIAVYVEATPDETETRILRGLRKHLPELPDDLDLIKTFAWLRRGEGHKVVVVLDQFEQWLHAHRSEQDHDLIASLRQCDGGRLQAVVMVRDDFAMAASRFMRELETRILEGHNFATVDLFDVDHAQSVLTKFGQAFGKLPAQTSKLTEQEQEFVSAIAAGLAQDGKVVSVRLALFAEMVKGKPWVPATLQEVGGAEGIGVNFLEETFSSRHANPEHRLHQQAAREVLKALLPEVGSDIKGHMRSHAELLEASGSQNRPSDFNDLLRVLDGELRLITPTDPKGFQTESGSDHESKFYQLTHDYLVPSLREWLTGKQEETRKGRAELLIAKRASLWTASSERHHLPSWWEWASIRVLTEKKKWTPPQRKMMKRAGRFHAVRLTMLAVLLALLGWAGVESYGTLRGSDLVESLKTASIDGVPSIVEELLGYRRWTENELQSLASVNNDDTVTRLHAGLALLPTDPSQLAYLKDRLLDAKPDQVETIRSLLENHKDGIVEDLWEVVEEGNRDQLLQAASALAVYDADNDAKWSAGADRIVDALVIENSLRVAVWIKTLRPARRHLVKPLGVVYRDKSDDRSRTQIDLATDVLEDYAADNINSLAELLLDAEPKQFVALFDELKAHSGEALSKLNKELDQDLTFDWNDASLDPSWSVPTAEVTGKIEQAHGMMGERFAFCQTMPMDEFQSVAEELRKSGYRPIRLRPYAHADSVHVAAAWTRDDGAWQLATGQSADALQQHDQQQREDGFAAVDVAGYIESDDDTPSELYTAIWVKKNNDAEDTLSYAGAIDAEHKRVYKGFEQQGYEFQHSLQGFRGLDGQQKYCGVKSKAGGESRIDEQQSLAEFNGKEYFDKIVWDIDPSNAPNPQTTKERIDQALAVDEAKLKDKPDDLNYTAVWNESTRFESLESHGLSPSEHLAKCKAVQAEGYRLVSISAASIEDDIVTASVWHRPLIPDAEKETLARRQANAAVAALRMNQADRVWPLLRHSPDPRLRSWIIHRLSPMGAAPDKIVKRLNEEPDVSVRRALILILGEYEEAAPIDRSTLSTTLLGLYRNDPDPGIHGATEWVLRRWGKADELAEIDTQLATGLIECNGNWYSTKQGHTMVVVPGPSEFLMGSPSTERDRSTNEYLHRQRIDHSFAIATKEVTVRQFQEFLRQTPSVRHSYNAKYAPEESCSQTAVYWYEAAAYCRWLSEQELIPEDQMCYPEIAEIKKGMKLPSDYLSRTGYRLPSEAEWEYACRSGTNTSRYYGQTDELLGQYAWFAETSDDRAWPVGSLKPNDRGLFDMQGNVWEWCQERYVSYSLGSPSEDREDTVSLDNASRRVLRGGSFANPTSYVRPANRFYKVPDYRLTNYGFRVARTYDLSP